MQRIAAFITAHGYGHATRSIAVLEALQRMYPQLTIDICTTVPQHLFTASLANIRYHRLIGDVGFIQHDALTIDLAATVRALDQLLPYPEELVAHLATRLRGCDLVLADIAPLGILVARRAGIPSVLVENFTWDWIYQPLLSACPSLGKHIRVLQEIYAQATLHIQAEPVCRPAANGVVTCPPIFRCLRQTTHSLRQRLGVGNRYLVVVSMGGIDFHLPTWQHLNARSDCFFVLAGRDKTEQLSGNCLGLAQTTDIHHPDLINCADLVVLKSGYSTVAECLQGGTRILCITRPAFAESAILERFVCDRLEGSLLAETAFLRGSWIDELPKLLARKRPAPASMNGADIAARHIRTLCTS